MTAARHRIVVVGSGFGGMAFVEKFRHTDTDITLIDRNNHQLFQPLLYQAATTVLAVTDIAWPVRELVAKRQDVAVLQADVTGIDRDARTVHTEQAGPVPFDTLIISTGSETSHFGHDDWARNAPGLKTAADALQLRSKILCAFEAAEREDDSDRRQALMTFIVIGAGPTGVELAGMISHLCRHVLRHEYRRIDPARSRILLVEGADRALGAFDAKLSRYAEGKLADLGVELMLETMVDDIRPDGIVVPDDGFIPAETIIWAAGVAASPAAKWLGAPSDDQGRVKVEADLSIVDDPAIFVIGDTAAIPWKDDALVPGIAPGAKQAGAYVADVVRRRLDGDTAPGPFRYKHDGDLATIGPHAAIIDFGWLRLRGNLAWWTWGFAHIFFLIGVRSRLKVMLSWLWQYAFGRNSARLSVPQPSPPPAAER